MMTDLEKESLEYHANGKPGKVEIVATKPCKTQKDLSLAYTPGVAKPCLEIEKNPEDVWKYTAKGNSVAVVSDCTAVLGLGNIGAEAGMPVMEGKAVLFKKFADIDTIPLCLSNVADEYGKSDAGKLIETVERLEPSFGGINLEDIAAPACFEIEKTLKKSLSIPVFHDDQHGTAIISMAAMVNALKLLNKNIADAHFVINGAGAAGIACAEIYIAAGATPSNLIMCDIEGVIHSKREHLTPEQVKFALETDARTLAEALVGADVFLGVSAADCVTEDMVRSMAPDPVIFPMANPVPEISPRKALAAGAAVVGSGRSDFQNQINNVLGFPGIFRGALDSRASDINEEMKIAAVRALTEIAEEKIPEDVMNVLVKAYPEDAAAGLFEGESPLKKTYVIPKPFDPRVVPRVARYVAEAAMKSGVATIAIDDLDAYEKSVAQRVKKN